MDVKPIRTRADHKAALGEIEALMEREPNLGTPAGDRLDILVTLVEAYEDKHFPIAAPDPVAVLKELIGQSGRSQAELAEVFGSASRASEVLARKRHLTKDMMWKLHRVWNIPAEVLLQPYRLRKNA